MLNFKIIYDYVMYHPFGLVKTNYNIYNLSHIQICEIINKYKYLKQYPPFTKFNLGIYDVQN